MTRVQSRDTSRQAKQEGNLLEADQRLAVAPGRTGEQAERAPRSVRQARLFRVMPCIRGNLSLYVCRNPHQGQGRRQRCVPRRLGVVLMQPHVTACGNAHSVETATHV